MNLQKFLKLIKLWVMNKKERSMMSMECHLMNRKVMKIWASMEIKVVFQILEDLVISGEDKINPKEDLKVFLEILKIFLVAKNPKNQIDQPEEKI